MRKQAIRSTVELRDNANSIANSSVRIRYFTSCLEPLNANMPPRVRENNTCDGLQVGTEAKTVSFNISVEVRREFLNTYLNPPSFIRIYGNY